ncbi:hypothetical protein E4U42_003169 [Claviceps africana]|uniref:Uncharacterized protein n=1 Tax=Claviceps africana TaxID=83212 RepID=A0A8K0J9P1_9HYPO|nr:hypothetical protein E4U42_003169 [Claviceps africana]
MPRLPLPRPRTLLRAFHSSRPLQTPYKDAQDRASLKPQSVEQIKSARDDDASDGAPKTAFHRGANDPAHERKQASDEAGGDPLGASGANQALSKPQGDEGASQHGAGREVQKGGRSRRGAGEKNKGT